MNRKFQTVDEYIEMAPAESQAMARQVRQLIKEAAPKAEEKISYQMPYYGYNGRLIYFGAYKNYIGLYVMSGAREALKEELEPYITSKATLHFPLDKPLPASLIKKIIKAQVAANTSK